ncbi:Hypothetical protein FKW44_001121 [Caligus rogercresseyi]|uniref:Uncharacterized protein n=1 Tax=Caligus rogercresseyi TaxID=217165 RepID=A0A7T8QVD7_CALRO|nr:Hypothetical protein FKW44_001121 [Caligus rogercresseyi]
MPHYCAWRGPRVLGEGLAPYNHHCAWRDRSPWPRVRNPNTPSLCLAGSESPLARVRKPQYPITVLGGPRIHWPRVRNPNLITVLGGTRKSFG